VDLSGCGAVSGGMSEDDPHPPFLPVRPLPGGSVCSVLLDGVEIARATYDKHASIIQCRREGVPKGAATILRRIARQLTGK
jgi:hypothetical protein